MTFNQRSRVQTHFKYNMTPVFKNKQKADIDVEKKKKIGKTKTEGMHLNASSGYD
jgi:hypothetical protein